MLLKFGGFEFEMCGFFGSLFVQVGSKSVYWDRSAGLIRSWRRDNPGFDE